MALPLTDVKRLLRLPAWLDLPDIGLDRLV